MHKVSAAFIVKNCHPRTSLNFEPSFVGIHQVLTEIWFFEHEFQNRNFANFEFLGVPNLPTNFHEITKFHSHFQPKLKR